MTKSSKLAFAIPLVCTNFVNMNAKNETARRVSVVMCTYNGARFLREQMDSILAQDYPLHEIIVQDDGSTDDTLAILEDYRRQNPSLFHIHRNSERLGVNRNFHAAMLRATGEFIAISDQDDVWKKEKVRRLVEAIGDRDASFSDMYAVWDEKSPEASPSYYKPYFEYMLLVTGSAGHTMLVRTDFVRGIDYWEYGVYYDWWLCVNAWIGKGIVKVEDCLVYHRKHAASVTTCQPKHYTWQPYVYGYFAHRRQMRKANYQRFYTHFAKHIDGNRYPVAKRMAQLMLRRDLISLFRLCCLCCKNYKRVYYGNPHGLSGRVHGFFAPFIIPYVCDNFQLEQ